MLANLEFSLSLEVFLNVLAFHNFPGIDVPWPPASAAGAWTQTSISAWLASVPIVPVLRNDYWFRRHPSRGARPLSTVYTVYKAMELVFNHSASGRQMDHI